ncbi:MAG: 16S rRNA (cytosine(1402)-N(4))-methyltransferase RsmH [Hyphomicrobiales bacterium]|nr:16S rRNA (cytosine(1402)-N(4))-methyltransferase RsmH [Hyphomicrobiales bacterium]
MKPETPSTGAVHLPVMLPEVLAALRPAAGEIVVDATFGAGGYTQAFLREGARVLAFDRDPGVAGRAAELAAQWPGAFELMAARFGDLAADLAARDLQPGSIDGIVFDIGVSSMQLDQAARGFSFRHDGPLDMRMGQAGRSAADIIAMESADVLADIFYHYGEERQARRIARAIVHDRAQTPFTTTRQLAELIARLCPARPQEIHPATRSFQALRIAVNDELGELVRALEAAEAMLAPGGRLVVVSFHSLEDRIVKRFLGQRSGRGQATSRLLPGEPLRAQPSFEVPGRQPLGPSPDECATNPRARSARLRWGVRTMAAPLAADLDLAALASLPQRKAGRP